MWGRKNKTEPIQSFLLDYIILKYGIFTRFWIWVNLDFAEIKRETLPVLYLDCEIIVIEKTVVFKI